MSELTTAFILNMYDSGLGIARNLGRYNIPVIGIDKNKIAPGSVSRYCNSIVCEYDDENQDGLIDCLIDIGSRQKSKGVLLPTSDFDINFIVKHREILDKYFLIPMAENDYIIKISDKYSQFKMAEAHGFNVPKTYKVSTKKQLNLIIDQLSYPLIIKPADTTNWKKKSVHPTLRKSKGIRITGEEQLRRIYGEYGLENSQVIIQQWIGGESDQFYVYGGYYDSESNCLGHITLRKLRQYPPGIGLGCIYKADNYDKVKELGDDLLKAIDFSGIAEVEFKFDKSSGQYYLIEINPRHWDQHEVGTKCDVNLSYLAYMDLCYNKKMQLEKSNKSYPVYWVRGTGIVGCLKEDIRNRKLDVKYVLSALKIRSYVFSFWRIKDPMPFFKSIFINFMNLQKHYLAKIGF